MSLLVRVQPFVCCTRLARRKRLTGSPYRCKKLLTIGSRNFLSLRSGRHISPLVPSRRQRCAHTEWLTVSLMKWCRPLGSAKPYSNRPAGFVWTILRVAEKRWSMSRYAARCRPCQLLAFCALLVDTTANLRAPIWNWPIDQKESPNDSGRDCSYSAQLDQCQIKNEFAHHSLPLPLLHQ